MDYDFPREQNYFIITGGIPKNFGGLTNALLHRAKLFGEQAEIHTTIITFYFATDWDDIIAKLIMDNKLNFKYTSVINMYHFYNGSASDKISMIEDKLRRIKKFVNSVQDRIERRNCLDKKEDVDKFGKVRRVTYLDTCGRPKQELYYDERGNCYLRKRYRIKNEKSLIERIIWFDQAGRVKKEFKSNEELQTYWLEEITNNDQTYFFINDSRAIEPSVLAINKTNVHKVHVIHSVHMKPPFQIDSVVRPTYRPIFKGLNRADAVVFLTEAQSKDVQAGFGERNNYFVIPHSIKPPTEQPKSNQRNLQKAVVVSRFNPEKQLDHVIKAFKLVTAKNPEVILEIYGSGPEEGNLRQLIAELGLQQIVFLRGYTLNTDQVYASAAFSVLCSKFEGFGLVILESLANGCPVLSYDIKYGPSDMIVEQHNGALVSPDNIEGLAKAMENLFKAKTKLEQLSKNAYLSAHKFSEGDFLAKWSQMLHQVLEQSAYRTKLEAMEPYLQQSDWKDTEARVYEIEVALKLMGEFPKQSINEPKLMLKIQNRATGENFFEKITGIKEVECLEEGGAWVFRHEIPLSKAYYGAELPEGVWDLSVTFKWNNTYFQRRIGAKKTVSAGSNKATLVNSSGLLIRPYYTNPYGNLSFAITEPRTN